ncbi:diguanylate cyclase [Marinobacter zhanjiangensis]|uniref:diguanylate cyclase n=1 Tax=Marinobacter zhanjiangensis TaxID=578215 RepID=A0ABQ3AKH6_9GAMM|nr:diguanylate cyclase [Marinobacter zhanjiangensis]GGY58997.1 GGDEF domain-containing protein [Marinobacter zhanjiangensis]
MLFVSALFFLFLVTLLLARYAWVRREVPAARAVAAMMAGISWWTLCYALELLHAFEPGLVPEPEAMPLFWFKLMFVGVCVLPAAFLIFVLQYTGVRERISPRLVFWLAVEPVLVVTIALTDGLFHDWFLAGFTSSETQQFKGGPAFWLHTLYSYLLTLVAYALLIRFIVQTRVYRKQAVMLLFGGMASSIANILTILQALPESLQGLDISPFGFMVTAVLMLLNIRKQGFLDVMPIARSLVFEHMADGVLVTDAYGRLVDRNPAARYFFEYGDRNLERGLPITELVPGLVDGGQVAPEIEANGRILSVQRNLFHTATGKLRGVVYGFRNVTDLKQIEADLREQLSNNEELRHALKEESIRDPLTGLYNRRWLDEVLEREIPRALREQSSLSFCLIDLDFFKRVNDTWGHDVGDRILVALARLLKDGSRKHDVAARFGGEEFVLVLPGLDATRGREVVDRLRHAFTELDFGPDGPANLTFSAGLAVVPDHATDRENLFKMADRALYEAKETGRNRVVISVPFS